VVLSKGYNCLTTKRILGTILICLSYYHYFALFDAFRAIG